VCTDAAHVLVEVDWVAIGMMRVICAVYGSTERLITLWYEERCTTLRYVGCRISRRNPIYVAVNG
jgi:hypothetical protein